MRHSIDLATYKHGSPIPSASRIGPMIWSSPVSPYEAGSFTIPAGLDDQLHNLFTNIGAILGAAGAGWEDVGKMEFFIAELDSKTFKEAVEPLWLAHFPDPDSRPARHTIQIARLLPNRYVMATFMAYKS